MHAATSKLLCATNEPGRAATRDSAEMKLHAPVRLLCVAIASGSLAMPVRPASTQLQNGIAIMVSKTCDVMSGKRKLDGQTLQYLIMLDDHDAFGNPIEMIFQRQVIQTCPKAYLSFEQRKRANNPFRPGTLIRKEPTPLLNGPN